VGIADQLFSFGDNLYDDADKRGVKQLKKETAEREALKEAAMLAEQKEARREKLNRSQEDGIRAAAERAEIRAFLPGANGESVAVHHKRREGKMQHRRPVKTLQRTG
jgi:hypothetical protein